MKMKHKTPSNRPTCCLLCKKKMPAQPKGWQSFTLKGKNGERLPHVLCPGCFSEPPHLYRIRGFGEETKVASEQKGVSAARIYLPPSWAGGEVTCILTKRPEKSGDGD